MSKFVISVENLSKSYRLGQINTGMFTYDMLLWWVKVRGSIIFNRVGQTFLDTV
jgi:lipopolysaccharide transport system ATP-binding protein